MPDQEITKFINLFLYTYIIHTRNIQKHQNKKKSQLCFNPYPAGTEREQPLPPT